MAHEVLEGGIVRIGKFVHLLVQPNVPQTIIFVSCDRTIDTESAEIPPMLLSELTGSFNEALI